MQPYNYILLGLVFLFTGCEAKTQHKQEAQKTVKKSYQDRYVDFKRFAEGRPCSDVKFQCLPESIDKNWQEQNLSDGLDTFELTPEVNKKYDRLVKAWNKKYSAYWDTHDYETYWKTHSREKGEYPMKMSSLSKGFFERVEAKRFLVDMEKSLEKEFPGFWREVDKPVRYRWIRRAMSKADKYGYNGNGNNIRAKIQIIDLCARIGLDFDKNSKWKAITEFISRPEGATMSYGIMACHYIDFTVFKKDYSPNGDRYTDWYLREALQYLPRPKRPIPKLND